MRFRHSLRQLCLVLLVVSGCRTTTPQTDDQRITGGGAAVTQTPSNGGGSSNNSGTGGSAPVYIGAGLAPLPNQINVDALQIIRPLSPKPLGINVNFLQDNDGNRSGGQPLATALTNLGVHFLRYPGGEKSDWQFWSTSPWSAPNPQVFGWYTSQQGGRLLDFDTYMSYVRAVGAEPYIVVGYDSVGRTKVAQSQYLANAVNWVRYANIVKGYGIKYWEIGNENWNNGTGTAAEIAAVAVQFAQAMKQVDPTIKVGTSGNNDAWWQTLLPVAGPVLDFLVISNYPPLTSFAKYLESAPGALEFASATARSIAAYAAPADAARLTVIATEFNAIDWTDTWADANDVAHALVNFDTYGQLISEPKLTTAMFWTTRWMDPGDSGSSAYYALDGNNQPTAQGTVVGIWGKFLLDQLVAATSPDPQVVAYASYSASQARETVFLINKSGTTKQMALASLNLEAAFSQAQIWCFSGTSPTDSKPQFAPSGEAAPDNNREAVTLAPYSVTVVDLK